MSNKTRKKQLKQVENQAQEGRSMVEMLGVLAIIAILSIGGIVGYKLAMNYYQADQIANEINLMRNDLKVKYALGNEELLLGDPYDDTPENEDYSGHLSTQYDRYPVDYDCIRKDKAEFYNCREADAYYIKVGNVSKGVCKPLTTLVAAMDGLMSMEINKKVYKEDDLCDEANEIYVEFDAEDVNGNYDSNRPEGWCGKDGDCEGLSTPVCDKESNTCVECVKEGDCSAPRSVCDVANHECVECIENTDCKDLSRPRCNVDSGDCESCPPEKPVWNNEECVECTTNAQCVEKGKDPHCHKATHTCEPCPDGSRSEGNACVIHIQTIPAFKAQLLKGYIKRCQKLTPNHFGPYTHSYELWIHGTFDDYVRFYVNEELPHISSTEPIYNDPDDRCNKINHKAEKICAGVGNSCSVYLPDYHLGTLNAGDFGHLTIYDVASWITWGEAGLKEDISRADAAAWLVLGDE